MAFNVLRNFAVLSVAFACLQGVRALPANICEGGQVISTATLSKGATEVVVTTESCPATDSKLDFGPETAVHASDIEHISSRFVKLQALTPLPQDCSNYCTNLGPAANLGDCGTLAETLLAREDATFESLATSLIRFNYGTCDFAIRNDGETDYQVPYTYLTYTALDLAALCFTGQSGTNGGACAASDWSIVAYGGNGTIPA